MSASDRADKHARKLRRERSLPEKLLWVRIRRTGLNFRRQHPIGDYVVYFNGLPGEGVEVRIPAKDVLRDPEEVADTLNRRCADRAKALHHSALLTGPPPQPSARGEL